MHNNEIMRKWYIKAIETPGSVDSYLRVVREADGESLDDQRQSFGVDDFGFLRLRGMRLPRSLSFVSDARRIAEHCALGNPDEFVDVMLTARAIVNEKKQSGQSYQAAFDPRDGLDDEDV